MANLNFKRLSRGVRLLTSHIHSQIQLGLTRLTSTGVAHDNLQDGMSAVRMTFSFPVASAASFIPLETSRSQIRKQLGRRLSSRLRRICLPTHRMLTQNRLVISLILFPYLLTSDQRRMLQRKRGPQARRAYRTLHLPLIWGSKFLSQANPWRYGQA